MNDFESIGGYLRSKREEKGISIEDVSEELCLRSGIIDQIETGKACGKIPDVYLSGYIKQYARFLGCEREIGSWIEDLRKKDKQNYESQTVQKEKRSFNLRRFLVYAIILLVLGIFFFTERGRREKEITVRQETPIQSTSVTDSFLIEKKLVIACHERTWISVIVDGKERKEFMLNPRDVVVLNAKEGFDLLIGNAGGVKLVLNGKELEALGSSGEVRKLKLY